MSSPQEIVAKFAPCVSTCLAQVKAAPLFLQVLAGIGSLLVTCSVWHALGSFASFFLRPAKNVKKYGKWGLVTGATDGIGKALAMELARKGLNVALVSRTQSRLETARNEILAKYPKVEVKVLAADMSQADSPAVRKSLENFVAELGDIGVLFNNVGISYDFPQFFAELPDDRIESLISLNLMATLVMTKVVLPGMAERKRGVIINMSSGSARVCAPLLSVYGGTKRGMEQFSQSLAAEYASRNVQVQCHTPMFVATKLAKIRRASFLVPSPTTYARASVAKIGHEVLVSPYWPHALQIWVYEHLPSSLVTKVAMNMHLGLRKRALKKLADKKSQ